MRSESEVEDILTILYNNYSNQISIFGDMYDLGVLTAIEWVLSGEKGEDDE